MSAENKAWVIDDERNIRWVLEKALTQNGWEVSSFDSADKALNQLSHSDPDVIITDIRMPVIAAITSPCLSAGEREISLPSILRYQYAGATSSHNLQAIKKIWDVNSSSL